MPNEVDRFFDGMEIGEVMAQMEVSDNVIEGQFIEVMERGPSLADALIDIAGGIWDAATPMFEMGAEELMKGIYTGNAFDFHTSAFPEHNPAEQEMEQGREM